MKNLIALAAASLALCAFAQQQDFSKVEIKPQQIAGPIWALEGSGGNIGVVAGDDGVFVIDDQFAPLAPKIQETIGKISKQPIKLVFNTHWHGDHTGGNLAMGEKGAVIVAHENVRKRLSVDQVMAMRGGAKIAASPGKALPVVTFVSEVAFWLNGEEIRVVHAPKAHTDGDAIVRFVTSNAIHTGDLFVNGGYPIIDIDSGGSVDGLLAAQEKIISLADEKTKVIPGHGPVGTKADVQTAHDVLAKIRGSVAALIKQGKTQDQVVAAKPTADLDAKYGGGFMKGDMLVSIIYASLTGKMEPPKAPPAAPEPSPKK